MLPTSTLSRIWNLSPSTIEGLRREFDSAFSAATEGCDKHSPVAIWEAEGGVTVEVDVPGIAEDSLSVTVEDGVLQIAGERHGPEHDGELKYQDRRPGNVHRSISLHETLDPTSVVAELDRGVLTLKISRKAEAQPRKISIGVKTPLGEAVDE